jgi:hypothetical protein
MPVMPTKPDPLSDLLQHITLPARMKEQQKKGDLLGTIMPNGKALRDCTGVEVAEIGARMSEIADWLPPGLPVSPEDRS